MQSRALKNPLDYIYQSFSSTEHLVYWYSVWEERITILLGILLLLIILLPGLLFVTSFFFQQNWQSKANTTKTFTAVKHLLPWERRRKQKHSFLPLLFFLHSVKYDWIEKCISENCSTFFATSFSYAVGYYSHAISKCISSKSRGGKIALIYLIGRISEETEPSWS